MKKRTQKYVDNIVNDLHHEIKFEICVSIFFAKADTKKRRYASGKALPFVDCQGKFQMLVCYFLSWVSRVMFQAKRHMDGMVRLHLCCRLH